MRFSKIECATVLAALKYLQAHITQPEVLALDQFRSAKPLPTAKIDRLCAKIASGEKEIVYLEIQGGVAVFSGSSGVALVHSDWDSLQNDPNSLPELVIGSDKKKEIIRQVSDGLDRLRTLRPATAGDKDIRRLNRQLCRLAGVPSRPHQQSKPQPAPKPAAESRPIRFTTLHNATRPPVQVAQPLPA